MTQYWNEYTQRLEPTYWDEEHQTWTDPPIAKGPVKTRTHALRDGLRMCGAKRGWIHKPGAQPTCPKCLKLSQMTQL